MKTKHYTIPIFIPELACPFQCLYCDQHKITGQQSMPEPPEIIETIESYLASFPKRKKEVQIGFFGGNFTGIEIEKQEEYLKIAHRYLKEEKIQGIRLSTRPDYITEQVIRLLKKYKVTTVELGAQSMVEEVLLKSGRGHTVEHTIKASGMIRNAHIRLGLQMMIGLPGDRPEYDIKTASDFVELGVEDVRIYPTLVIRGTALEKLYREKKYQVLKMEEAVERTASVMKIFEKENIRIIRVGLHPSEGLSSGDELVAGPYHESFRELVMTAIWAEEFSPLLSSTENGSVEIHTSPAQYNFAIGYEARNKKELLKHYKNVVFMQDDKLKGRQFNVNYR